MSYTMHMHLWYNVYIFMHAWEFSLQTSIDLKKCLSRNAFSGSALYTVCCTIKLAWL